MELKVYGRDRWDVQELRKHLGVVATDLPGERTAVTRGLDAVVSGFFSSSTLWPNLEVTEAMRTGATDYLTKPFAPDEMAARIEVLLRRQQQGQPAQTKLRVADLELDMSSRIARRGGRELTLLPTEYRLLEFLMRYPGQVLTRAMIFESVWGLRFDPGTNLIDVHIARLRRKVDIDGEPSLIRTMRGSGYRLG